MLEQAIEANSMEFLTKHANAKSKDTLQYAQRVYERYGFEGIDRNPDIIIGTIHSVKGAGAWAVYLDSSLSPNASNLYLSSEQHRNMLKRLMYVGITRAMEVAIRCAPSDKAYLPNF